MKEVKSFGKGGEPIPNTVERFTEVNVETPKEDEQKFTPESVAEDESLKTQLPTPTGYRIMILPFSRKQKTKGGIYLADSTLEKERIGTNVGYVVSLGPDAYKDKNKFPEGAWCKEKDWVIFGRYAGARIKIDGGDLRLLNDDDILAVVQNPEDVVTA
jgi:chaperonin GroES